MTCLFPKPWLGITARVAVAGYGAFFCVLLTGLHYTAGSRWITGQLLESALLQFSEVS